jgi:hypothetical protein
MFSMSCTNKGCYKQMEPFLDPATNKVHCSICDGELINVTNFTKNQMKANKQFRKKNSVAFGVKCNSCGKEDRPVIVNNDIVCSSCKKPLKQLSEPFKIMLRDKLKSNE